MRNSSLLKLATSVLSLALVAVPASALTVPFSIVGTAGGQPVNATASVTTSAGQITVTLNNLQANPLQVLSLISGFSFDVAGAGLTTLTSLSQPDVTITGNLAANVTAGSSLTGALWSLEDGSGPSLFLNSLGPTGPSGLVIGPPGAGGAYSAANASIAGNGAHNPFFQSGVTFTLTAAGVTAASGVSNGAFFFGTNSTPGSPGTVVPDGGSTAILLGLATLGLGLFARRFRRS